jgi:hypothetical protein
MEGEKLVPGPDEDDNLSSNCSPQPVLYFLVLTVKQPVMYFLVLTVKRQDVWWPDPCMVEGRWQWVMQEMRWENPIFYSFG